MNPSTQRPRLAPSLLSADFADLAAAIRQVERGGADALHLDVMDGHFVPNISFGPALVEAVRQRTHLPLDVHLMISEPGKFVEAFARAGGDTLVFHVEATDRPVELIREIHRLGKGAGVALKPETPIERIDDVLGQLDQILVMSVNPGFSGQAFIPGVLPKVRAARSRADRRENMVDVSVDGGITPETALLAATEGASFFVCGNSVFGGNDVVGNLKRLRASVDMGTQRAVR